MTKKPKGLFDDIDELLADFDRTIRNVDNVAAGRPIEEVKPPAPPISGVAYRPSIGAFQDGIWDQDKIRKMIESRECGTCSLEEFYADLEKHAKLFIFQGLGEGETIIGWGKGDSNMCHGCDPVTAVLVAKHNIYLLPIVCHLAGELLGLTPQDAKTLARACWNTHPQVLKEANLQPVRDRIVQAIKTGGW